LSPILDGISPLDGGTRRLSPNLFNPLHHLIRYEGKRLLTTILLTVALSIVSAPAGQRTLSASHVPASVRQHRATPLGAFAATNELALSLCLPIHHQEELSRLLAGLYNPAATNYHHYLKPGEFAARFGPTPEEYRRLTDFATAAGLRITGQPANRMILRVSGRVATVQKAFHVELKEYQAPAGGRKFHSPTAPPVVDETLPLLEIHGLDDSQLPRPLFHPARPRPAGTPQAGSGLYGSYMGADFRAAYTPGTLLTGAGQTVGLLQLDGYDYYDITNYTAQAGLTNIPLNNILLDGFDGSAGGNNGEVCLDIEMVMSMAPGLAQILVYEGYNPLDIVNQMATDDTAAQLSSSWAWGGGPGGTLDQIFQQMAAQGQTFFQASGDLDAYLPGEADNPTEPNTPTDDPWVTCVGGTQLLTSGPGTPRTGEIAWNWGNGNGTGGGVSCFYPMPSWQAGIEMTTNGGSTAYRNFPDVAMVADGVMACYSNGSHITTVLAGTSCATPLWAGFAALANQQAAQNSQPPIGFLNPTLYALGRGTNYESLFNDITVGNNTNSSSPLNYPAEPGYDLCTGWGTPTGTNLINALAQADDLGTPGGTNWSATGPAGGSFLPSTWTVTLTNTGSAPLPWSVGGLPAWLAATPASGTLATNAQTTFTLTLTPAANQQPPGNFPAPVIVTNILHQRADVAAVVTLTVNPSLVLNGGFETGDFTHWTLVGDTVIGSLYYNTVSVEANFPGIVHSGFFGAFLGEFGYEATLSQTLPTVPGAYYLVSSWLNNPGTGTNQFFNILWNGTNYTGLTNPPAFGWTNLLFVARASTTNTVLTFAAENDPNYFGVDDVSVQTVPPVGFSDWSWNTNGFNLTWFSLPSLNYTVQSTTNLLNPIWTNLATLTAVTNLTTFTDTNSFPPGASAAFYRLVFLP